MYIDTHLHLSKKDYPNIEEIIRKANNSNVKRLIVSGCDIEGIKESIGLANQYEEIYLTLGFHPEVANKIEEKDILWLEEQLKHPKVIGLGEIGLDYHWIKDNKDKQKEIFLRMLEIAKKRKLPVIIHSRDAAEDTLNILKKESIKGIIHCFSGSLEIAKDYIKLGYYLGIGGVVTFKNAGLQEIVSEIKLEHLLLETDSPYLAPNPHRGKQNSPEFIPIIAEKIAELKKITTETVEKVTTENANTIFNFKSK